MNLPSPDALSESNNDELLADIYVAVSARWRDVQVVNGELNPFYIDPRPLRSDALEDPGLMDPIQWAAGGIASGLSKGGIGAAKGVGGGILRRVGGNSVQLAKSLRNILARGTQSAGSEYVEWISRTFTREQLAALMDESDEIITLYRGVTTHEGRSGPLFLTIEDYNYAASYSSNVQKIQISRASFYLLKNEGLLIEQMGTYGSGSTIIGREAVIENPILKDLLLKRMK